MKIKLTIIAGEGGGDIPIIVNSIKDGFLNLDLVSVILPGNCKQKKLLEKEKINFKILNLSNKSKKVYFEKLEKLLHISSPDIIYLAGYCYVIPKSIINNYRNKIINSHHSLLPAFPGLFMKEKITAAKPPNAA